MTMMLVYRTLVKDYTVGFSAINIYTARVHSVKNNEFTMSSVDKKCISC